MAKRLNRREALNLFSTIPFLFSQPYFIGQPSRQKALPQGKNIFIIVFDTLSAANIPLYGYSRQTMPNLARFAECATVYHNHFASGIFTTPGTASLLTGVYPWTHRAIRYDDRVIEPYADRHIFSLFDHYHRVAYSHNSLVNTLFLQFNRYLDIFLPRQELFLNSSWLDKVFKKDYDTASLSWIQYINRELDNVTGSLFLSDLYQKSEQRLIKQYTELFPEGIPSTPVGKNLFILENAIDWAEERLASMPRPFLLYLHLLPPHNPYKTRREFINVFNDGWKPKNKSESVFTSSFLPLQINQARQRYDEYLLYVDAEFGRLYDWMQSNGILEDTWVVFTSDHGEMFERGILFHEKPVIYQPVVKVPLIISSPGQRSPQEIFTATNAVDVLPTLLQENGLPLPDWVEGQALPPFRPLADERSVFALEARKNNPSRPLTQATAMNVRWPYKLVHYWGWPELLQGEDFFELFDLEDDPEELENLYTLTDALSREMSEDLQARINAADVLYK
jgi:arylsulfatase A-like enzyme